VTLLFRYLGINVSVSVLVFKAGSKSCGRRGAARDSRQSCGRTASPFEHLKHCLPRDLTPVP
jgi:hypothetical protein